MNTIKQLTKRYNLSKTLRFELIPQGDTLNQMAKANVFEKDEHLAQNYTQIKKVIDRYHKQHISKVLSVFANPGCGLTGLETYYDLFKISKRTESENKDLLKVSDELRKQIAKAFSEQNSKVKLFDQKFICSVLPEWVEEKEEKELLAEFYQFTTYFQGFYENRKNMYVADHKANTIPYRIVHDNLPIFINNLKVYERLKACAGFDQKHLDTLYKNIEEYLNVHSLDEIFVLDYYNMVLTQEQIDVYNMVIGGKSVSEKERCQGLNEYINLYNQRCKDKKDKLPQFTTLKKQILSDRERLSFVPDVFEGDTQLLESIKTYCELLMPLLISAPNQLNAEDLLGDLSSYDLEHVYITNSEQYGIDHISQKLFHQWDFIRNAVLHDYELKKPRTRRESLEKYEEKKEKYFKGNKSFSIAYLNQCIAQMGRAETIEHYFRLRDGEYIDGKLTNTLFDRLRQAYHQAGYLLSDPMAYANDLAQCKQDVHNLKQLLDALKQIAAFMKPLLGAAMEGDKDELFYGYFAPIWGEFDALTSLYNKVRNRMTRKPYTTEKIKLNFESSTLLNGWSRDEKGLYQYNSLILQKEGRYYLAIISKKDKKIFSNSVLSKQRKSEHNYQLVVYKQQKSDALVRLFIPKKRPETVPDEIFKINSEQLHKQSPDKLHKLIDYFKSSIQNRADWKNVKYEFLETEEYENISDFYKDFVNQSYDISFESVSEGYIDQLVAEGKLYLFQIYNKDFSAYSKGRKNLHTMYWESLFTPENLQDVVFKLNGQAEVFYRKKSITADNIIKHAKRQPIDNKNPKNPKKQSTFEYDLIKDRRYTVDKLQFHVPITLNFKAGKSSEINKDVKEIIKAHGIKHVIGIDRGERHLLYFSVIDLKGRIVEQFSLNTIESQVLDTDHSKSYTFETDYQALLATKEKARTEARKSWMTIQNIKELKSGYLSQVVQKVCRLIVKYQAIVVLEDLNQGFKRGRQKVERAVYQQFERALIEKLNYLVFKEEEPTKPGGLLNAYQLANKFESIKKIGLQSGLLFYVAAWNTSNIDPVTGFVNLLDTRYYSIERSKDFFQRFDAIQYNKKQDRFEFVFDYNNFHGKADGSRTQWTVCTVGKRIRTYRNPEKNSQWDSQEVEPNVLLKSLFNSYKIDLASDLKAEINRQTDASFFQDLLRILGLTLQLRNSSTGTNEDYIASPVADSKGHFFCSKEGDAQLPIDADANGAYNIARKGLMLIDAIKQEADGDKEASLAIRNKAWLCFAQAYQMGTK